jgi:two-component system sensor histidine kinase AgrC
MTGNVMAIYLITSAFGTYIIYRYMKIFFDSNESDRIIEISSYVLYYFAIGYIFIKYNSPMLNVFANLVMFFLLTFNYQASCKRRLIATTSIYMILLTIESVVAMGMKVFNIDILSQDADLILLTGLVAIKILSYIVMLFLSNFKMVKNDVKVSSLHWVSIFVIPVGTLMLSLQLIINVHEDNITGIIISIVILFVINIFVFYLYDVLMKSYNEKMEKALLIEQSTAYAKQLEIINQSQENLKVFRHDIKNHVLSLKTLIENNHREEALSYLDGIFACIDNSVEFSKSGNPGIDSILNYKLNQAAALNIKTDISINVPERLNIRPFDLSVILGNLLDNAIEAARCCEEKLIKISAELDRNVLYINVSNTFNNKIKYDGKKLITTKTDKEKHGMGLISVQQSLEKYNGAMEIHHKDNMFYVDILIYNQANVVTAF